MIPDCASTRVLFNGPQWSKTPRVIIGDRADWGRDGNVQIGAKVRDYGIETRAQGRN